MTYEFFEPFPDIRGIRSLFVKDLLPNPKISFDFTRAIANPKLFSFINMINLSGHFKAEYDPWVFKSTLQRFEDNEKIRLQKENEKQKEYLEEISLLEIQAKNSTGQIKDNLEKKIANMKKYENQHYHTQSLLKPNKYDYRFLGLDIDFNSKFENDDSVKIKYGNSGIMEANFILKNLVDKETLIQDMSSFKRNIYDILKTKELNVNLSKELGKSNLKTINFQLKSKTSPEFLSLTVFNNTNKVEKIEKVDGIDKTIVKEKLTSNYKLVYNCPLNENLKIKATFFDNFLTNNNLEVKLRKNIFGKLNFQNYYNMRFSFNSETVLSKERNAENRMIYNFQNSLINILKPEKAVFAFTYDFDKEIEHKFRPYFGFVVHNLPTNKLTSLNLGYLHNMDFTKRDVDGTIYGLKINYSLFYKYDDLLELLKSENLIKKHEHHQQKINIENIKDKDKITTPIKATPIASKENLTLGSEFIYLFNKNDYLYSCTGKVLLSDAAIRIHKNFLFKNWGEYFKYLDLAFKFNMEREDKRFIYKTGVSLEIL